MICCIIPFDTSEKIFHITNIFVIVIVFAGFFVFMGRILLLGPLIVLYVLYVFSYRRALNVDPFHYYSYNISNFQVDSCNITTVLPLSKEYKTIFNTSSTSNPVPVLRKKRVYKPNSGDHVEDEYAKLLYSRIIDKAKREVDKYVSTNCHKDVFNDFCQFPILASQQLNNISFRSLKSRFDALKLVTKGDICEGCAQSGIISILPKTPIKGQIIRKFIGKEETEVIFTPENRKHFPILFFSLLSTP